MREGGTGDPLRGYRDRGGVDVGRPDNPECLSVSTVGPRNISRPRGPDTPTFTSSVYHSEKAPPI